ncbi:von Willebrand factor [Novipirellula aureliae]|uniref:von Willebrand factor n=1 Tax=Novipirellula aureliae TaxID=2527966 RepID=A0A5C6E631_9BACT|nr:von Willebrand factor type A domain-containing protein [Novipirellula aureliae]TWU43081.1 von Willebrand factor [Novipirellula aureliae]
MTDSLWNDPRITAYVLDELPPAERAVFEGEMQSNQELATAVAEARAVTTKLDSFYAAEIESTPTVVDLAKDPAPTAWRTSSKLKLATAACIAMIIVGISIPIVQNQMTKREVAMSLDTESDRSQPTAAPEAAAYAMQDEDAEQLDAMMLEESMIEMEPASEPMSPLIASDQLERAKGTVQTNRDFLMPPSSSSSNQNAGHAEDSLGTGGERGDSLDESSARLFSAAPAPQERQRLSRSATEIKVNESDFSTNSFGPASRSSPSTSAAPRLEMQFGFSAMAESPSDEGIGPGMAGDRFDPIDDNTFRRVSEHPLSTFSIDVDTASYSKVRDFLMRAGSLPRPDAVRLEEMVNYFDYAADPPADDSADPFAVRTILTECPWNREHRLARVTLKGKELLQADRPKCNLVFLIDTSGSMNAANKLPLVQSGLKMLIEQLNDDDQVAIVVYAGSAGLVLDSTPISESQEIRRALTQLSAGGSTNGGQGITLAYQTARDHFIKDGVNRVILCSDGDFNVGTTGTDQLVRMVETEAKGGVFLSVLGFGMGNHNDAMLEQISGRGNGNYAFIDTENEAKKVLVDQTSGTLVTIAKDVKLQVEFNPAKVDSYRLLGYENRVLAKEDFNDDKKDAGEIGAGHTVTALYEIVPAGVEADASRPRVDDLKYQAKPQPSEAAQSDEMMTLKLRYKKPDGDESTLIEFPVVDEGGSFSDADNDTRFAAAVAGFAMQLRKSDYRGTWTIDDVIRVAKNAKDHDAYDLKAEFVQIAEKAKSLIGE